MFASHAEYRAPFKLPSVTFHSTGITDQLSLRADRVLWRDQSRQLSANLQLAHKDVDSYLEDARLGIQSPTLTVAEAGLNLFWLDRAVWNLDFTYSQGLRWLGADDDANHQIDNLPKAQFRKYRAGLSQWRNGQFGAQAWQWQSQLNLQYSPDPLPAIEQLLGTDDSAVRGYRVNSASGASGAIWRNTLRLPLRTDWPVQITPACWPGQRLAQGRPRRAGPTPERRQRRLEPGLEESASGRRLPTRPQHPQRLAARARDLADARGVADMSTTETHQTVNKQPSDLSATATANTQSRAVMPYLHGDVFMPAHTFAFHLSPRGKLRWAIASLFFAVHLPSAIAGGVVVAPGPGGTAQLQTQGGVPIVNIVAPNGSGLSHNQFLDYNVDRQGLVLNNALQAGQSQLAGQLAANPQLQGQAASVILNEVISRNPSAINGAQEIFGRAADYVLANPNGISVNGGSFINTPNANLVVGRPELHDGKLQALNTRDASGQLQIQAVACATVRVRST